MITVNGRPVTVTKLQIADCCPNLISTIPKAPRDEKNSEEIAEFLGDDSLQSSGYGLYAWFGRPSRKPLDLRVRERVAEAAKERGQEVEDLDPQSRYMMSLKAREIERKRFHHPRRPSRFRPGRPYGQ